MAEAQDVSQLVLSVGQIAGLASFLLSAAGLWAKHRGDLRTARVEVETAGLKANLSSAQHRLNEMAAKVASLEKENQLQANRLLSLEVIKAPEKVRADEDHMLLRHVAENVNKILNHLAISGERS